MKRINDFYESSDKSNFYLGKISQVNRAYSIVQVENLTLFSYRKMIGDILIPNTINYYVLIDSNNGLFFGEIFQSRVPNSMAVNERVTSVRQDKIFPEVSVDILSYIPLGEDDFILNGTNTVGITDKVYIANQKVIQKFVGSLEINPCENKLTSFAKLIFSSQNYPISLQPKTLFDRHLMAVGTTNSGKSTSALSILDKLICDGIRVLIIDPTGEYSASFNDEEVSKITLGNDAFLPTSEISINQWEILFETNDGSQPAVLADAIQSLRYQKKRGKEEPYQKKGKKVVDVESELSILNNDDKSFSLSLLSKQIEAESVKIDKEKYVGDSFSINVNRHLIKKVNYKLSNTSLARFFTDGDGNLLKSIEKFCRGEITKSLYINASKIGTTDGVGGMIIDLIANFTVNLEACDIKPFVMFIDEVHRYTKGAKGDRLDFYTGLNSIAREGRKMGIFLFLTTQRPNDVDKILLGQVGTLLIHRLTSSDEIKSIQNHLSEDHINQIKRLNAGEAILTSINLLKDLYLKVEKCNRSHDNVTPSLRIDNEGSDRK